MHKGEGNQFANFMLWNVNRLLNLKPAEKSIKITIKNLYESKPFPTHLFHYQKFDDKLEGNFRRAVSKFNRSKSAPSYVSRASFHSASKRHPRVSLIAHLTLQKNSARCASSRLSFSIHWKFWMKKKRRFFVK